jgi:predicted enzyme related to lactoylglutathione lyase
MSSKPQRRFVVMAGLVAGVLAMSGAAYAVTSDAAQPDASTSTQATVSTTNTDDQALTDSGDHGMSEELLTGDLATQVTAAAEAAVPGGTVVRVETDAQGAAYEAHMTDADGTPVTVTFDEDHNVLATNTDDHGAGHGQGPGGTEELLTGDLATQVTAAAEAAVPGGTVVRVETDAQGAAYEAHMTDADGTPVTVTFDEDHNVLATNTDDHGAGHGHGHRGAEELTGDLTTDLGV